LQQKFHNIFKVYDSNGELVFSFGSNGEGNGQFNAPTGVAVDSQVNRSLIDCNFDWFLLIHSQVKRCLIETLHFSVK
jgi:DNA-binding beta-propeller fold protein YncE